MQVVNGVRKGHIQETTEALIVLLLGVILLLLNSSGLSGTAGSGTGSRGGRGVGVGVGNAVLELLNLGPGNLGLHGDSQDVLVRVDKRVHDGGKGGEVDSQGDGGNSGNGRGQSLEELLLTNVENAGREGLALVVNLGDAHTVGEGRDVQHVEQGSLGGADLGASLNELEIGGDFNGTTGDLGGDTEGLEERGLAGLHTSVSSGNPDVGGSESTSTGGGGDLVGEDDVSDVLEVVVGENETDVALDERQETLVLGGVGNEGLQGSANLINGVSNPILDIEERGDPYHGVLAHQDNTLGSQSLSDLVHLLRADIVDLNDEDGAVLLQQALELVEVAGLVCSLAPHIFLLLKAGCLRASVGYCNLYVVDGSCRVKARFPILSAGDKKVCVLDIGLLRAKGH